MCSRFWCSLLTLAVLTSSVPAHGQSSERLEALKQEAVAAVESMRTFTQQTVDQIFSFGELGFQEFETSRHVTGILEQNGFPGGAGRRGDADGVDRDLGVGEAGDRVWQRHRRHSEVVAEAWRRLPRSDHRRRAGPR